ncbi:MAG: CBS domain-containing protein, partial [Acidimicrobiaceae bacterium]|nr:CBS domain-containing protein [Acidimicrobiaceae bacterium]
GLFIPLAALGVVLGEFVGQALGNNETTLYPILGLAAFLGAGYRAPIAAVMFVAESTGGVGSFVVPALVAAAVSQVVAGPSSVADYQRSVRLGHLERRLTLPIGSILSTDVMTVPPDATVSEFVYFHVLGRRERIVPVVENERFLGLARLEDIAEINRDEWEQTTISEHMATDLPVGQPSWTLRDAVAAMGEAQIDVIAVTAVNGAFIGVVTEDDILKLDEILDETGN